MTKLHPRRQLPVLLVLTLIALATTVAVAFAGKIVAGGIYTGALRNKQAISFAVSSNGKDLQVENSFPPLFCQGGAGGLEVIPKPVAISPKGTFKATITYRVIHGKPVAKMTVKGKFSGTKVTGTVRSQWLKAKECNGTTTFSAAAT